MSSRSRAAAISAAALGVLTAFAANPVPALADVQVVAATGQNVGGHTLTGFFQFPDINNAGTVAYNAFAGPNSSGVFTQAGRLIGTGDSVDGVVIKDIFGVHPSLNNPGTVAFGFRDAGNAFLYSTQNDILFNTSTDTIEGLPLGSIGSIALGDNNHVAFFGSRNTGSGFVQGIYSPTAVLFELGDTVDGRTITGMNGIFTDGINDDGTIVFRGQHSGGLSLFTQTDELITTGQTVAGRTLSAINPDAPINNAGEVAFHGFFAGNSRRGIYTLTRRVVEDGDVIEGRVIQNFEPNVSISENGLVAYEASFVGGGSGLFVEQDLLLATGDLLNGKIVSSVNPPQVNDAGTIVAHVTFTDNTEAIVTATIPEPAGAAVVASLLAFTAGAVSRRRTGK